MRNFFVHAILVTLVATHSPISSRAAELIAHWDFEKFDDGGTTIKSTVGGYVGTVTGEPAIVPVTRPGGGGNGLDTSGGGNGGYIVVDPETSPDNMANKAAADDSISIVFWQKNNRSPAEGCCDASTFWFESPGSANGTRGVQVHVPWSNGEIMFDSSGCCAAGKRLTITPANFDFEQWHHYAFIKDKGTRQIWIDGNLAKESLNQDPLPDDFTLAIIGANGQADQHKSPDATIDDFALYKGALTEIELKALAAGAAIGGAPKAQIVAHWDFEKFDDGGTTIKSTVGGYVGTVTGQPPIVPITRPGGGGNGLDTSGGGDGGYIVVDPETSPDNMVSKAAADDSISIAFWQKNNRSPAEGCCDASTFWFESPSSANGTRGVQVHVPWSNGEIMFDSSGCCAAGKRLTITPANFDFEQWHHYAFIKDKGTRQIWIDGNMVKESLNQDPLPDDFTLAIIGANGQADQHKSPDATIDEFSLYKGALTEAEIKLLATGVPAQPLKDTDGDGISDEYETLYGLKPNDPGDAHLDPDGDDTDNLAEFKAGTNPTDTVPPTILSAAATRRGINTDPVTVAETVTLTFSEEVVRPGATNLANYSISPTLAITKAELTKTNTVVLTVGTPTPGTQYTVTVNGVQDTSKKSIAANSTVRFSSFAPLTQGILRFALYGNILDTGIESVTADPRYPDSPDFVAAATALDTMAVMTDDSFIHYGATMTGLLTPTETGDYDFFIRSNQRAQLFLNLNGTNSTEAEIIAQDSGSSKNFLEPGPQQTTQAPIHLEAGKQYYLQLIYKREANGSDLCQVAWRNTTNTAPAASLQPIPGRFFTAEPTLGPSQAPPPPELKVSWDRLNGNLTLTWTGGNVLQRSDSVIGPWSTIADAVSPRVLAATGIAGFFRIAP